MVPGVFRKDSVDEFLILKNQIDINEKLIRNLTQLLPSDVVLSLTIVAGWVLAVVAETSDGGNDKAINF